MRYLSCVVLLSLACPSGVALARTDFQPVANQAQALHLAHLRYLALSANPTQALADKRRFSRAQLAGGDHSDLRLKLAELAANYGLLDEAAADLRHKRGPATGGQAQLAVWFKLAQSWYNQHDYRKAQSAFDKIYGDIPKALQYKLNAFEVRLLIARGNNKKAVRVLREWQRKRLRDPFARYNLGVALTRLGKSQEGVGELNEVGTLTAKNDVQRALRDQANLALGFGYLEIGQGATARALFQRIRLDGPFSDKALLGLGWAEIAPDGKRQKLTLVEPIHCVEDPARLLPDNLPILHRIPRKACDPTRVFRDTDRFKTKKGGATEAERYKNALIPWRVLARRDPRSPAVQEGLVAVAYAYAKLDARQRADEYFDDAIAKLQPEYKVLTHAIKQLQTPPTTGATLPLGVAPTRRWFAQRWGLYTTADTPFLNDVLSDTAFRTSAQSLQDLLALRDQLDDVDNRTRALQALLNGRGAALFRANLAWPQQLLDQQRKMDNMVKQLSGLEQQMDTTISRLGDHLRMRALDAATASEQRLQTYLTNALVGRANVAGISSTDEKQP